MPQRTSLEAAVASGREDAVDGLVIPYNMTPGASVTPAAAATLLRNLRRVGSNPVSVAEFFAGYFDTPLIL